MGLTPTAEADGETPVEETKKSNHVQKKIEKHRKIVTLISILESSLVVGDCLFALLIDLVNEAGLMGNAYNSFGFHRILSNVILDLRESFKTTTVESLGGRVATQLTQPLSYDDLDLMAEAVATGKMTNFDREDCDSDRRRKGDGREMRSIEKVPLVWRVNVECSEGHMMDFTPYTLFFVGGNPRLDKPRLIPMAYRVPFLRV
ncbi:hypothetical protein PIB30_066385 [Stylosanthes scabra]|uniref:Uncharacterized protein n=1 Tax=Stylosanthes scabra TaxID=79078 RepID=A0ABU6VNA5_9FABA|nr:hypothetical protein [Stylosanthes scabra]